MIRLMSSYATTVSQAPASEQAAFYRRTYTHVAGALAGFAVVLYALMSTGLGPALFIPILKLGTWSWLLVMGAFWLGTSVAQSMAANQASRGMQYAGLSLYVVMEALIFVPIMIMVGAATKGNYMEILDPACTATGVIVAGLTAVVFLTGANFSFLRTVLTVGSLAALGVIVVSALFGLSIGGWFSIAMILLMSAAILYQTWAIREQYATDQHVSAAIALFAAIVTLLWYVIRFFLSRRSE